MDVEKNLEQMLYTPKEAHIRTGRLGAGTEQFYVLVRPHDLEVVVTKGFSTERYIMENITQPEITNFYGLIKNLNATEVKQEIEVLRAKEKQDHHYGSEYYNDALDDVRDVIKRLIKEGD